MNTVISEKSIPTAMDVSLVRNKGIKESIIQKLSDIDVTSTKDFALELIDQFGSEKLASVLIENLSKKTNINQISLTGEPPVSVKKQNNRKNYNKSNFKDYKTNKKNNFRKRNGY